MDAADSNIFEILDGKKQYVIPIYQRLYRWEKEQCERLWNDIVEMQSNQKGGHFIGSIVNIAEQVMPTGVQHFTIIDGQQRITTLTLMLIALRNYALDNLQDDSLASEEIENTLLKNPYGEGDDRYKLLLTEADREILKALVERKTLPKGTSSRLIDNLSYFEKQINKKIIEPVHVYESMGRLQIVNITLERSTDDAQTIFESLNSTGKNLSESDLIRNYVLMGLDPDEQNYIYEHQWRPMELLFDNKNLDTQMDNFFRDYLTSKQKKIPKKDRVYEEFKVYMKNISFSSVRDFCQELYQYAQYYTDMVFCRSDDSEIVKLYEDIRELKMEVVYPFLLNVHCALAQDIISESELKVILRLCITYVFRRSICGIPTNSHNKTFATLINYIRPDNYINSLKARFVLQEGYKRFPNDDEFKKAFVSRDVFNMRSRNFLLNHLENFDNKSRIMIEGHTIEHIMPQNPNLSKDWQIELGDNWREVHKTYLHTIGNITLTTYNSEMSDRPFSEKMEMKGGFKESALRLNAYVVKQDTWNQQKIEERANILAEKAMEIWPFPQLAEAELLAYSNQQEKPEKFSIESYEWNDVNKSLFETLDNHIMNLSPDVKREFRKVYIAYKYDTNFVDVIICETQLNLVVNLKFSELYDPYGICQDVSNVGHHGNGEVKLKFDENSDEKLKQVMRIIEQGFRLQADE